MPCRVSLILIALVTACGVVACGGDAPTPTAPTPTPSPAPPPAPPPASVTVAALTLETTTVAGGTPVSGTVTLSAPAPEGGVVVTLAVSESALAATEAVTARGIDVPASITVAPGATSAAFTVTTEAVSASTEFTITASAGGATRTASLRVIPDESSSIAPTLASISLDPSFVGGQSTAGTVTLSATAPAGGTEVALTSSASVLRVPATITVPQGATGAPFAVTSDAVTTDTDVTVTASAGGATRTVQTRLRARVIESIGFEPSGVEGGESATGTVTLSGAAPAGGQPVTLTSEDGDVQVPASITIPEGRRTGTFPITTREVSSTRFVLITATTGGQSEGARLRVNPPAPAPPPQANTAPTAVNDAYTTNEDATLNGASVLGNDADAEGQALTAALVSGVSNGTLTLNANGTFTYSPSANVNGVDTFTYRANDGTDDSNTATVTITVGAVNDAPSFTAGGNQTVNEDVGAQAVAGWATGISAGPSEGSQTVSFTVTSNTNTALFSAGPAVAANGSLTYTPAANAAGTATITLQVEDDGGTANGGSDTSGTQQFTITVTQLFDDSQTFNFTGASVDWDVPATLTSIRVEASGAQGGAGDGPGGGGAGANGGSVTATITVTPDETLRIFVGGQGGGAPAGFGGSGGAAGFNGGAAGGNGNTGGGDGDGGGGGGASDVRRTPYALADRLVVAGGGGGGGGGESVAGGTGGAGGGLTGADGADAASNGEGGGGGTQAAGGAGGALFGQPGASGSGGAPGATATGGGGGGGGYFGGGGGGQSPLTQAAAGGGGGSSFTAAGATSVTHTQGNRAGNGEVTLRW